MLEIRKEGKSVPLYTCALHHPLHNNDEGPLEELQRRKSNSALAPRQRVLRAVGDTNHAPGSKLLACVAADVGNHSLFLRFDQVSIDCLCTWRKNASCTCGQVIDQWERAEGRDGLPNV